MVLRAELPLAVPLMMTGIRTAAVQVVATATLAALLGGGTLGSVIRTGFARQDNGVVIAGALLVAVLAAAHRGRCWPCVGWVVTPGQKQLPFTGAGRARPATGRTAGEPAPVAGRGRRRR